MLLEKSKYTESDIISFKLINGDEIIGKYVKEDMMSYSVNRPVMLAMTKGGPAMAPIMMTVNPDNDYTINKSAVMFNGVTVKEIAEQYIFQTTGIQPVSAGSIVTG
jgi:hypothetical protein